MPAVMSDMGGTPWMAVRVRVRVRVGVRVSVRVRGSR